MAIWSAEIKELERLNASLTCHFPELEKELSHLVSSDDPNVLMLYSRRCLEVIISDLCEKELKRPRKTDPLKGIIDKLNKEEKVPSHIITSMHGLNDLSTYGAHPKDFDTEQVKPALSNLAIIIKWFVKYRGLKIPGNIASDQEHYPAKQKNSVPGASRRKRNKIALIASAFILFISVIVLLGLLNIIELSNKGAFISNLDKSIAVLPFTNLSDDPDQEYFSDGMMDEILDRLFKIGDLKVISRTSSMRYKNTDLSLKEIAGELGVSAILEGSVRRAGNIVRITVQLIDARNDTHLWSETYDGDLSDLTNIFSVQSEVAQSVARELKAVISPEEKRLIEKIPDTDLEVYDEYLKARYYISDPRRETFKKALEYLNSAVEKNPGWAHLYAGLAEVWLWIQQSGWEPPSVAAPKIFENLNKALELDPDLAGAHYLSGLIAQLVEWNWEKSEKEFLKALAINPNDAQTRMFYAQLLLILQRNAEALAQIELAVSLDPLNPNFKLLYVGTMVQAGEFKTALSLAERIVATDSLNFTAYGMIFISAYMLKEYDKAFRAIRYLLPINNIKEEDFKEIERIFNNQGFVRAYEEILKHNEKYAENNYVSPMGMAYDYIIVNHPDKAMDWIEKAFATHDQQVTYITASGRYFEQLFGNPRFIAICEKMNLPLPKSL